MKSGSQGLKRATASHFGHDLLESSALRELEPSTQEEEARRARTAICFAASPFA